MRLWIPSARGSSRPSGKMAPSPSSSARGQEAITRAFFIASPTSWARPMSPPQDTYGISPVLGPPGSHAAIYPCATTKVSPNASWFGAATHCDPILTNTKEKVSGGPTKKAPS